MVVPSYPKIFALYDLTCDKAREWHRMARDAFQYLVIFGTIAYCIPISSTKIGRLLILKLKDDFDNIHYQVVMCSTSLGVSRSLM